MAYTPVATKKKSNRFPIDIDQTEFPEGYTSEKANSRRSRKSVSDATNMELVEDNVWRPRASTVQYGTQPANPVIGRVMGGYRYNGMRGQLFLMNVAGVGKWYYQLNGGAFTQVGGVNAYDPAAWAGGVQSKNRVYVFNGINNLSYIDLTTMQTVEYTSLATPATPSGVAAAGLTSGTKPYNYYYKVTANNVVGESAASNASAAINVNAIRDNWSLVNSVVVSWTAVVGATSYTVYGGTDPNFLFEIITLSNLTTLSYTDDGSLTLNPFKLAPSSNSTQGAIFLWMYVDKHNAQVYGITSDNKLYYSAAGTGDFSSLNGGGFTTIDEGGDTALNFLTGFRTGKGDPVITTSSRGAAGKGELNHVTFDQVSYGDQVIFFPNVIPANGQAGTYAPRATVKAGDSIIYPTGDAIKSSGTSQNIVNILTTQSLSRKIVKDVNKINLAALDGAAGCEYQDKVFMCLPVGSDDNNEIWYMDLARENAWVLRWTIAAKDIWLYEDNSGYPHLCVLVDNKILEFTRAGAQPTTDDGVPFRTRLAFSSLVWDDAGICMGNIDKQYFKLLDPRGSIAVNTYGLGQGGSSSATGSDDYSVEVGFTGFGQWDYSGKYKFGDDVGSINTFASSVATLEVKPKGLLNQEDWEIITEDAGCDYILSAVSTRGMANKDLIFKGVRN